MRARSSAASGCGAAGAADRHRLRRFRAVGDARHHPRRAHRLRAVLQSELFRRASARDLAALEGRHVVPRRLSRLRARGRPVRAPSRPVRSSRSATSPARPGRSGSFSAASPISSTASCGAARPTCPGRWCFRPAGRCRATRASSTRRRWKGCCCSSLLTALIRAGALKRPGFILGAFASATRVARSICELFREPDPQLGFLWGGLTMGMLLSLPLMLAGIALIAAAMRKEAAAANMTDDRPARGGNSPAHRGRRPDAGCAIHGAVPHPSRSTATTPRAIRSAPPAISSPRRRSARCSAS